MAAKAKAKAKTSLKVDAKVEKGSKAKTPPKVKTGAKSDPKTTGPSVITSAKTAAKSGPSLIKSSLSVGAKTAKGKEKAAPVKGGQKAPTKSPSPADSDKDFLDPSESPSMQAFMASAEAEILKAGGDQSKAAAAIQALKNFRTNPDVENFYRFIYENDLRIEALHILDRNLEEKRNLRRLKQGKHPIQ